MERFNQIRFVGKPVVFLLCLAPFALVVGDLYGITGMLGANPIEDIQDRFGIWGLRFLVLTLAVTPIRQLTGWTWLARFRRMLGLYAFFYVLMHFLTWLVLDQGMLMSAILEDIAIRPFITIGFAALLILTALAVTSTAGMRRRMGKRWQRLHNLVYLAAILGAWHYWWQVKLDTSDPAIYATLLTVLFGYRIWRRRSNARKRALT